MSPEISGELLVEARGSIEIWRLHRPAKRNALGFALLDRLDEARRKAAEGGVCQAVVLTGHPASPAFCAGFDLEDLRRLAATGATTEASASRLHEVFAALASAPFSLVTAIRGAAVGGGCELALLAEARVAHPDATFLLPPSRLGVVYPPAGLSRLASALGPSLLGAMLVTSLPVSATRLHAAGVLWQLADDPEAAAVSLAETLASYPLAARLGNRDRARALYAVRGAGAPDIPPLVDVGGLP